MKPDRPCKDCVAEGITTFRPPIYPGPRCTTHHRKITKLRRAKAHGLKVENTYGITVEDYWKIYEAQGRKCAICQVSTGKARRLAVDHDHKKCGDHPPDKGCPKCVRALLCKRCNMLIGWWGTDALLRAIDVLNDPPAQRILSA